MVFRQFRGKLLPIIPLKSACCVILSAVKDPAQGQRIILQETLRDSSLTLRMTRYYEIFTSPKLTKNQTYSS